uniref:ATP-grasp domain-containing protein n=1 Tax=Steinernema glaseri TaxID=37863 RepID=A0A1I7Z7V8_9BILA
MLSAEHRAKLGELNERCETFTIVLKWKYPFFTNLENLKKPGNAALIGFFAEQIEKDLSDDIKANFDLIIYFKADYTNFASVYLDSNTISIPELDKFGDELVQIIPAAKIDFVETEEFMINTLCQLRERLGLPGVRASDIEHLRNKAILKNLAREKNIPTAKFSIIDFSKQSTVQEIADKVDSEIGIYPAFRKPISGCGSGGGGRLDSRQAVEAWAEQRIQDKDESTYLVEECLSGHEFWACSCLLKNGSVKPLYVIYMERGYTVPEYLKTGRAIPFFANRFEDLEDVFPKITEFTLDCIEKLKPPHPHPFCVQGFQKTKGSSDYVLTEVGYRTNGARGAGISYAACGVSQEVALIQSHCDPEYTADPDPHRPTYHQCSLWYPQKKGFLRKFSCLPGAPHVESSIEVKWLLPLNAELKDADCFADFLLALTLRNESKERLHQDAKWLADNWQPEISPN